MPDIDDRLQYYLGQIEAGVPKEQVLSSLKEGEQELAALIKLADAMRTVSHPMPAPTYSRAAKQKILSAIPQERSRQRSTKPQLGWLFFPSLTGAVALLLVMFITFATLGVWLSGPAYAETASIQDIEGVVELASSPRSEEWDVLGGGEVVRSGQRIRTSPGSSATLVYSDGSRTILGAETSILLRKIDGTWGGDIQVDIEQGAGVTSHSVVPLRSQAAYFHVRTPSGIASVQGTSFKVDVEANGTARVIVESGEVTVSNMADQVVVPAGQATLLQPGVTPEKPGNFFSIVDVVVSIENNQWTVTGQSFQVSQNTTVSSTAEIGQVLQIEGRILSSGQWVADKIQPLAEEIKSSFTGVVESISEGDWTISGTTVTVNEVTKIQNKLEVGSTVEVEYLALNDENWLALQIHKLAEYAEEGAETAGAEGVPVAGLTVTPTNNTEAFTVTCAVGENQAEAKTLAKKFNVTEDEILSWFCRGFGFGEIELAYNLSLRTGQDVTEIFDLRYSNMTWGEIYTLLFQLKQSEETAGTNLCVSIMYQPKAQQLAIKYQVDYEEIIEWYCQGFTFGQIDLAYSLGKEHGKSANEIFTMQAGGKHWGQIKKELNQTGGKPENEPGRPPKDEKPPKEDNPNKGGNNPSNSPDVPNSPPEGGEQPNKESTD